MGIAVIGLELDVVTTSRDASITVERFEPRDDLLHGVDRRERACIAVDVRLREPRGEGIEGAPRRALEAMRCILETARERTHGADAMTLRLDERCGLRLQHAIELGIELAEGLHQFSGLRCGRAGRLFR